MKISNTWKRRLTAAGTGSRRIGFAVLVITSSISGFDKAWHLIFPPAPPPITALSRTAINEADKISAFAAECVEAILTAATTGPEQKACYPDGRKYTLPTSATTTVSDAKPVGIKYGPTNQTSKVFAVKVQLAEQPYPGAPKTLAVYQLPVALYQDTGMQALDKISRLTATAPGAYLPLGYSVTIEKTPPNSSDLTPLYTTLKGFAAAYLTAAGGLDRFTTTDSAITPLGTYAATTLTGAAAADTPPQNPADNTELAVHIDVAARRPDYTQQMLAYPLTLRAVGGSWFVARIDALPVLADAEPTPAPPETPKAP
ncbi:hypothetical protein AWC17_26075 [Mycobacterium nebraskense]|uniref:Conjugal transfer protein n=1 Tax=Mycobacterium nebraskense TaxID=244292 RepID=A0A1X1ZYF6_9MYCO|nr:hypothetical protein [Mycobacterium nebraskense]ORW31093.1 hypothetical protein AWC17_26075 [Mycobacterium nebraskense]